MSKARCFACRAEAQSKCTNCGNPYCTDHGSDELCNECQEKLMPYQEENAERQARTRLFGSPKQKKK